MPYCGPSGGSERIQRRAGIAQGLLPTVEGDRRTERLQQVVEGLQFRIVAAEFRFQQPDFLPVLDAFDEAFETDRRAAFGIDEVSPAAHFRNRESRIGSSTHEL